MITPSTGTSSAIAKKICSFFKLNLSASTLFENVRPSLPKTTSITSLTPFSRQSFASFDFIGLEAFVISGNFSPIPPQKSFIPPPVPVGSMVAPL